METVIFDKFSELCICFSNPFSLIQKFKGKSRNTYSYCYYCYYGKSFLKKKPLQCSVNFPSVTATLLTMMMIMIASIDSTIKPYHPPSLTIYLLCTCDVIEHFLRILKGSLFVMNETITLFLNYHHTKTFSPLINWFWRLCA
ncbi:Hypothetical predicted protein [Octopus vulgaris]|uniref:Uncharacterized protein n=1 Tax=Octopus vulgaris TaxID=6645 RepID=A0AA36B9K1_OCTVU|nr:Hypothetical predicted protein [Octopus vulgaris]